MSPPPTDDESAVALAHRLLHLLRLVATTLAALVGLATTLGWV